MQLFPPTNLLIDELQQIKLQCASHALMQRTSQNLAEVQPLCDYEFICHQLLLVSEYKNLIANGDQFPSDNYIDIQRELKLLELENATLSATQVLNIAAITATCRDIFHFFSSVKNTYGTLATLIENSRFEKEIIEIIFNVFDTHGIIKSNATPELASIRRNLAKKRSEAEHQFITLLGKYRKAGYISETEESMRNGRRVIAIHAEHKRVVPGIIHDTSTTGKTVYLEAEQLIPINNAITGLEEEERHEIQRILKALTKQLQGFRFRIAEYYHLLLQFDFIQAKARYALDTNAIMPTIVNDAQIDVKQAVHPLLYLQNKKLKKPTIPFSLYLKNKNRILVISGPNAGGKTVCMKTVALLQLMLQSGFLVSCVAESSFGFFSKLMIDIGDSQSIEYELSTYSSRLQKMRDFLQHSDANSLFIIDELGTGTDPQLGGALAEAILEKLNEQKCIGIVTTHFLNLKILADKTEGLINGNMLFDPEKLEPRYKLTVGKPGSSYTFLVAERSGLDKNIIENARKKVPKQQVLLENMLREVEEQKNYVERKVKEIANAEKALDELLDKYNKLHAQGETGRKQFEQRIKETELMLVKKFDAQLAKFVNEWKSTKDKKVVLQKYQQLFGHQKKEIKKTESKVEAALNKKYLEMLKPGLRVLLKGGKVAGSIESIEGNKVVVIFNGFKTSCLAQNLIPESEAKALGKGKN